MARFRQNASGITVVDKITKNGKFPWPEEGINVHTGGAFDMASAGQGGAMVAGVYFPPPPNQFNGEGRVQHIDSTGKLLWGETGKVFAPDADTRTSPAIVSDEAGGALVTWNDTTSGTRRRYVARYDRNGEMLWKTDGFWSWLRTTNGPPVFGNDQGSFLWLTNKSGTVQGDLFAFRVDSSGIANWGMDGILIRYREVEEWPYFLDVTHDSHGGFIAVWAERHRTGWQNLGLQQVSVDGKLGDVITRVEEPAEKWQYPQAFFLFPTYPNPSNPGVTIRFSLRNAAEVELQVFNINGKLVRTLAENHVTAGIHELFWSGQTQTGKEASSGIYFIRLVVNGHVQLRKHLLIR